MIAFVALALLPLAPATQAGPRVFGGYGSICDAPDVAPSVDRRGSAAVQTPPVDAEAAKLIHRFVHAVTTGKPSDPYLNRATLPDQTVKSCSDAITKLSEAGCKANQLYLLDDGQIREEWDCRGKLAYSTFFTIRNGKIANIWSMRSDVVINVARVGAQ
jgi:hypothetical protein